MRSALWLPVALVALSCSAGEGASIQVVVTEADPGLATRLERIELGVTRIDSTTGAASPYRDLATVPSYDPAGRLQPWSSSVSPASAADGALYRFRARGVVAGAELVSAQASLSFLRGAHIVVPLRFEPGCVGRACGAEQTCVGGACRDDHVPPCSVVVGTPPPECTRLDGGLDALARLDAPEEAGGDAGVDGGSDAGTDAGGCGTCPPLTVCAGTSCMACGSDVEQCCAGGTCQAGIVCLVDGRCHACGADGEPCCEGGTCEPGSLCGMDGTCHAGAACGAGEQTCCGGAPCSSGRVCNGTMCVVCGNHQPCCAGGTCASGQACSSGSCVDCGGNRQPCCAGGSCSSSRVCSAGVCSDCGGVAQPCCAGGTCTVGRVCSADACRDCGGNGQPCCAGAVCAALSTCCPDRVCRNACS